MDVLVCQGLPWRNGPIRAANDCHQKSGIKGMKHYYLFIALQPSFVELTYRKRGYRYLDTNCSWYPFHPSGVLIPSRNDVKVSSDEVETSADCVLLLDSTY